MSAVIPRPVGPTTDWNASATTTASRPFIRTHVCPYHVISIPLILSHGSALPVIAVPQECRPTLTVTGAGSAAPLSGRRDCVSPRRKAERLRRQAAAVGEYALGKGKTG